MQPQSSGCIDFSNGRVWCSVMNFSFGGVKQWHNEVKVINIRYISSVASSKILRGKIWQGIPHSMTRVFKVRKAP